MNYIYAIFHLNLSYSSISEEQRKKVIEKCYWPLLNIVEYQGIYLGIELTAWTLQQIAILDPNWIKQFRKLLHADRCELIGSGYTQLIGPLVPYRVNQFNQATGVRIYKEILDIIPQLALVNEMAFVPGLVGVYKQSGYKGIIMDRDNVCQALGLTGNNIDTMPKMAEGEGNVTLPVLWSDSVLFQKLQRYAHGEISLPEYEDYLFTRSAKSNAPLPLYCNDAELFDFRPERYDTEAELHTEGEWHRLTLLFNRLNKSTQFNWQLPSDALRLYLTDHNTVPVRFNSTQQPIPVKKQLKYNISRWAVTGRDDTWLNTMCYRLYQQLMIKDTYTAEVKQKACSDNWQELCELWASDYRTHITESRWRQHLVKLSTMAARFGVPTNDPLCSLKTPEPVDITQLSSAGFQINQESENGLSVHTGMLQLVLSQRRGLTIKSLGFASHDFSPLLGTIPHGYFDAIELSADYYSNGTVIELIREHRRITDLVPVKPALCLHENTLVINAVIATDLGRIVKQYKISPDNEAVTVRICFPEWSRPYGVVRVGTITLLPSMFRGDPLFLETTMAGQEAERFALEKSCLHDRPASTLVSCSTGLGTTNGEIIIGNTQRALRLNWDPAQCAVFPMIHHQLQSPDSLTRLVFTLSEVDETFVEGGHLPTFEYTITPVS